MRAGDELQRRREVDLQGWGPNLLPRSGAAPVRGESRELEGALSDVLVLDEDSLSVTTPDFEVPSTFEAGEVRIEHDSITTGIRRDEIFYLMSRGLSEPQATSLIVNGFVEPVISVLPVEYAVEWTRLVEM